MPLHFRQIFNNFVLFLSLKAANRVIAQKVVIGFQSPGPASVAMLVVGAGSAFPRILRLIPQPQKHFAIIPNVL